MIEASVCAAQRVSCIRVHIFHQTNRCADDRWHQCDLDGFVGHLKIPAQEFVRGEGFQRFCRCLWLCRFVGDLAVIAALGRDDRGAFRAKQDLDRRVQFIDLAVNLVAMHLDQPRIAVTVGKEGGHLRQSGFEYRQRCCLAVYRYLVARQQWSISHFLSPVTHD